ncbi:hypothetical protein [uncultured Rikenella sp.]|uniref:hypothetical protein n=1 Tax=uncultured Rikenella sp. TaxID=368003 RepID=UPI0025E1146C|nr:hypothetical protein [uncultured Rikenella sp.]
MWLIGSSGNSYSSTPYDSDDHYRGVYLSFNVTGLLPSHTSLRGYGHQLRCLSE